MQLRGPSWMDIATQIRLESPRISLASGDCMSYNVGHLIILTKTL
jgi:hypothetical protein